MRQHIAPAAALLVARFPAITACRLQVEPSPSGHEACIEVLLPEHQIILNAVGRDAETARRNALALAEERLVALARRDPAILGPRATQQETLT